MDSSITDATPAHESPKAPSPLFDFLFLRPVATIIWVLLLCLFGLTGYSSLIKESLPDLEIPEFYILTEWEGATPAMVEKEVTAKIEQGLRGLKGIKKVHSSSAYGRSIVAVLFHADLSLEEAARLLQRQVSAAQGALPKGAKRSRVEASSVNDVPIATIALSGDLERSVLEALARELEQRLERLPGLRQANLVGARREIVQIQLDPERLKSYGIPATLVREQIISHGLDAPWGRFENPKLGFSMKMAGAYDSLERLEGLVITRLPAGRAIRLGDLASVRFAHLREQTRAALSWRGSEFAPVVALDLLKASGQDTIALVERARRATAQFAESEHWPHGVEWRLIGSQAEAIQSELERGFNNGWQAMLAVFAVLFILLTWREALVAAISVPLTLLAALALLWMMGYSFNLLVIVGMILALGLLVDDFILIMEGMHEGIFVKRLGFVATVRRTIRTYAVPSLAGSITTILVFLPLAFLGGVDGKFIQVIPVTAAVCLVMSYIVSLLLGPSMSRLFLGDPNKNHGPGWMDRLSAQAEQGLSGWIGRAVVASRLRATLWIAGALLLFVLSLIAAETLRDTLYPKEDGRTLGITVELSADTTLAESQQVADRISAILRADPHLQHVLRVVGGKDAYSFSSFHDYMGGSESPNLIGFGCFLIPGKERERLAFEVATALRPKLEAALVDLPGARLFMNPEKGGASGEDAIQVDISGDDMGQLRAIAAQLQQRLATISGVVDIRDNLGPSRSELRFRPLPEALDHYQISQESLATQMVIYMENEHVARFQRPGTQDDLQIRLTTEWGSQGGEVAGPKAWEELAQLAIIDDQGRGVPLWALTEPQLTAADDLILHKEGQRSVTVLAKLEGAYASEVLEQLRPEMEAMKQSWPEGYDYLFAGEEEVEQTYNNMLIAFLLAMVLVYAILALLFDSLLYPGIILSTVLFSLVGVFFGFMLADIPFSFSASIGIVALVGIVVNDAIIMVETMRNRLKSGESLFDAAKNGAADRLRPILSTTVTNIAGLTPLALSDPGWAPLCQAIIFGELTATVGAMVIIPALFMLLTRERATAGREYR